MELFFPSHIPTFSSCLQLNLCLASPCNLEVSLRVLRWAQKTEWNLLNAADIRSGGDAPAGSTAGCQLMGLDVWVRLQDCPDFDNAWGQSERVMCAGDKWRVSLPHGFGVTGHSSVRHHCWVKCLQENTPDLWPNFSLPRVTNSKPESFYVFTIPFTFFLSVRTLVLKMSVIIS